LSLRAGKDTAEWAHERSDVRGNIKHRLAPVFDSVPVDAPTSFPANRYWTRLPLGRSARVVRVEITNVNQTASLALWKAVVVDNAHEIAAPLVTERAFPAALKDQERWDRAFNNDNVLVLRNTRSRARAWLVTQAEAVDGEEALRRIRGERAVAFDPFRTALLEVEPAELPRLGSGNGTYTVKQIAYKPNGIEVETEAYDTSLLVVSETNFPGWVATVDGKPATLYTTDFILQSVAVPAGKHRVELRYTAPAARNGAIISLLTLILLCGLGVRAWRSVKTA
jgi:hypothetical protein